MVLLSNHVKAQYATITDRSQFWEEPDGVKRIHRRVKYDIIQQALSQLSNSSANGISILDLGCGRGGDVSKFLSDSRVARYVGVDISERCIAENKRRVADKFGEVTFDKRRATYALADAVEYISKLPTSERFDLIHMSCCLHYMIDSEDALNAFVRNVYKHIMPGGMVIYMGMNDECVAAHMGHQGEYFSVLPMAASLSKQELMTTGTPYMFHMHCAVDSCVEHVIANAALCTAVVNAGLQVLLNQKCADHLPTDLNEIAQSLTQDQRLLLGMYEVLLFAKKKDTAPDLCDETRVSGRECPTKTLTIDLTQCAKPMARMSDIDVLDRNADVAQTTTTVVAERGTSCDESAVVSTRPRRSRNDGRSAKLSRTLLDEQEQLLKAVSCSADVMIPLSLQRGNVMARKRGRPPIYVEKESAAKKFNKGDAISQLQLNVASKHDSASASSADNNCFITNPIRENKQGVFVYSFSHLLNLKLCESNDDLYHCRINGTISVLGSNNWKTDGK